MISCKSIIRIFIIIIINCQFTQSQYFVPIWFKEKPKNEEKIISVGYTGYFIKHENAQKMSVYKAIIDACAYVGISISTTFVEEMKMGYLISVEDSEEMIDYSVWDYFMNNYSILDSFSTDEGYYVLLVINGSGNVINYSHSLTKWGVKPSWINTLPSDEKYIYGLGMSGVHTSHTKAWLTADRNARSNVAKNLCINAKTGTIDLQSNYYSLLISYIHQKAEISLSGVEIIERWYDDGSEEHYSLARAIKNPINIIYGEGSLKR